MSFERHPMAQLPIRVDRETAERLGLQTNERTHMHDGEQHTHEETVKDEHTNEDGSRVETEKTETTEAEKPEDE